MKFNFALLLTLAICLVSFTSRTTNLASTSPNEIVIQNFSFEPATLTVKPGTTVTWVNRDDEPHTATRYGQALQLEDARHGRSLLAGIQRAWCLQLLLRVTSKDDRKNNR